VIFEWTIRILSTEVLIIGAALVTALWLLWMWLARRERRTVFVFTQYEVVILLMPIVAWLAFDVVAFFTGPLVTPELVAVSRWSRSYALVSYGYVVVQHLRRWRSGNGHERR